MPPRIVSINDEISLLQRSAEEVGTGTVYLTIVATPTSVADRILHWRIDTGRLVPLDLAINATDGTFRELTLFLLNDMLEPSRAEVALPPPTRGIPTFDLSHWTPTTDRIDTRDEMALCMIGTSLIAMLGGDRRSTTRVDAGPLQFLLSEAGELNGFIFPQLDVVTLELLRYAQLLRRGQGEMLVEDTIETSVVTSTIRVTVAFRYPD